MPMPKLGDGNTVADKAVRKVKLYQRRATMAWKWLNYTTGQTRPWMFPDRMYLEATNICNLECVMCPTGRHDMRRKKGYMSFDLFRQIVDEMAPHIQITTLHIWGEPLLHPRLFEMIRYCRDHHLKTEISSNATLLNEERARALLDAGLDLLYLCQDGVKPETYEAIRRRADFAETRANILRFLEMKVAGGYRQPFVNLQIIEMAPTAAEIATFVREWSRPGVDQINVKPFDSWGGQVDAINALRPEPPQLPEPRFPCPNLWYHVHIYWDGTLAMCDRDFDLDYPLDNVRTQGGVMRAWNGPRMQALRQRHCQNDYTGVHPCDTCPEWAWWKPTLFAAQGNKVVPQTVKQVGS